MEDQEQDFTESTTVKTPKNPDVAGYAQRSLSAEMKQQDSTAKVLGRFERDALIKDLQASSSDIITLDDVQKSYNPKPEQADDGRIVLPPPPDVESIFAQTDENGKRLIQSRLRRNNDKLQLISDSYKKSLTPQGKLNKARFQIENLMGSVNPVINLLNQMGGITYVAGEGAQGTIGILADAAAGVGMAGGKILQSVGDLAGNETMIEEGVLQQDWVAQKYMQYQDWVDKQLGELSPTGERTWVGKNIVSNVVPVAATVLTAGAGGAAVAGRVAAKGAARGVSEAAAKKVAQRAAQQFAKRTAKTTAKIYGVAAADDYWLREAENKTPQEYMDYLRAKTGGEVLSDLAWGTAVGVSNYYLENLFGSTASVQRMFGNATKGLLREVSTSALGEGITEVAQDEMLDLADLIRGRMSGSEFMDKLISPETLQTFVVSALIGGFAEGGQYVSARANLVKEYKANLKRIVPEISEDTLDKAGEAFINSVETDVIAKSRQAIMADDQLRNQYGTYWEIVNNRINDLVNQSIQQGKELGFKDKSPEYQAQFVGSVAQQFVDELYAQAQIRGVPIDDVFNITNIDVENGVMYMYGAEYGRRPLTEFNRDLTPAEYARVQAEKRIADELAQQHKAEQAQIREAQRLARQQEKQQAKEEKERARAERQQEKQQARTEQFQTYRDYLITKSVQSPENLTDQQARRDARIMARADVRAMPENLARGVLNEIRPDLPVQSMTVQEIKQILRGEIDRLIALQNFDNITPIEKAPSALERQAQRVEEVFNQTVPQESDLAAENARLDEIYPAYTGETINIDGQERSVFNSNGERIAQSEPALRNFYKWFGNSKVVDEQGRPLVVYHGTDAEFDTFDISHFGETDSGDFGRGFYLTADKRYAEYYGGQIMPLYLKIENPYKTSIWGYVDTDLKQKQGYDGVLVWTQETVFPRSKFATQKEYEAAIKEYQEYGRYNVEIGEESFFIQEKLPKEIVAFEPNQIKSVDNRGTFSSDTGNIFYQSDPFDDSGHRGRGYVGYSMSVNMAEAQSEGRLPASKAAKELGVSTEAIKTVLTPTEWHHASSWYNKVDVYDINPYLAIKNGGDLSKLGYSEEEIEEFKQNYEKMKSMPKPDKTVQQFYGNAQWIEWTGTRKNPKAIEHREENIKIEKKGQFYTFFLKDGTTVRKKVDSNGTSVLTEEEVAEQKRINERERAKRDRLKQIREENAKDYEDYKKKEHLDKPTQEVFSKYSWDLNYSRDNAYISGQKPRSETKDKGLRRIHINQLTWSDDGRHRVVSDGVLQEWNGENWVDIEKVENLTEGDKYQYSEEYYFRNNNEEYKTLAEATGEEIERILGIQPELFSQDTRNVLRQQTGKKALGSWNPVRKAIELYDGANETTITHELSHFWLDNMMMYSRLDSALNNTGFMTVWRNIKRYLNIDDRQDKISESQAEKYTSAYMQYLKNDKSAPAIDLGFKGLNEYIGDMAEEYFENSLHRDEEGDVYAELEELTPEIIDVLQKLTTFDLSKYKRLSELPAKDKTVINTINETNSLVESNQITPDEKDLIDSAMAVQENAIDTNEFLTDEQSKESDQIKVIDSLQDTENDTSEFDVESGNVNRLAQRLETIAAAQDMANNDLVLQRYDTHRDMLKVAEKADEFVRTRFDDAMAIINGEMPEQDGLFASDLYVALERKAKADGDFELLSELKDSKVVQELAKKAGQYVAGFRNYTGSGDVNIVEAMNTLNAKYERLIKDKQKQKIKEAIQEFEKALQEQDLNADSQLEQILNDMECK